MNAVAGVGIAVAVLAFVDLVFVALAASARFATLARTSDGAVRGPLAWILAAAVEVYRAGWSGRNAGCCRFEPSCSAYALTAVTRHGGVIGGLLAIRRLLRCQPLSAGGYDPVPGEAPGGSVDPGTGRCRTASGPVGAVDAGTRHGHGTASLHRGTRSEIVGSRRGTRV